MATFGALYTNYDVIYLLLEDLFLPNAMYRRIPEILLGYFVRIVIILGLSLETARSATFFGCCSLAMIDHCTKIVEMLIHRVKSFEEFLYIYMNLRLLYCKIAEWAHNVIYLALGLCFWVNVGSSWVGVQCYGKIHWPVYYSCLCMAIFFTFAHIILLPHIAQAAETGVEVVKLHYRQARLRYSQAVLKSRQAKLQLKRGKATAPVKFWYGPFWVIGKRFAGHYFSLMLLRTFDSILIINY